MQTPQLALSLSLGLKTWPVQVAGARSLSVSVPSCVCVHVYIVCVFAHAYAFKSVESSSSFILAALKWSDGLLLLKLCLELRFGITLSKKPRQILSNILEVNKAASLGPDPFLVGEGGGQWSVNHHLEPALVQSDSEFCSQQPPLPSSPPSPLHGHSSS